MQTVLIAGAGKSSAFLIDYMLTNAKQKWKVVIMDANAEMIAEKLNGHPKGTAAVIDIHDENARQNLVKNADIVLSLMPPDLHFLLAKDCLKFKKNLITSSYVSDQLKELHEEAKKAGILFMCEMGLDPGIDHMSANAIIHGVQRIAGSLQSFKSYCGGLVAPESDNNPWHYKISWNPRNIVLAGKQGAVWLENGKQQEAVYEHLFATNKKIKVADVGSLAYYPNRDSLKYLDLYSLPDVKTFMRATLRYPAFMKAWDVVIKSGLTQENDEFEVNNISYADWIAQKTGKANDADLRTNFMKAFTVDEKEMKQLDWLGIFENRRINGTGKMSSADILQSLLEEKWKMKALDKDMVVMQHQIEYERKGVLVKLTSTMVVTGESRQHSAMAKTVGLPMAILAKKILLDEINIKNITGVQIPVMQEVYVPVLKELKKNGIEFMETIE
ncbi:saccharopine dehydrogenase C-terminal domain-containing protein [Taibaiella chishuiensis]|uniref:Saccharopine dehydrogenase-like NADP-dependent oxidoreductase n=1 Tax=Taibaiella chishuiensis TaxID=1434707 RepID=A0A2P8CY06_9BACT|nr:saccharopine dehydrogenase C-terminal domain-containing protein [Taibaiella chishuiensis]PSK89850.1 saccharopine dehydrogenase-like NADP-dependent oxidoreductase [Taibaiella chishuiensis]